MKDFFGARYAIKCYEPTVRGDSSIHTWPHSHVRADSSAYTCEQGHETRAWPHSTRPSLSSQAWNCTSLASSGPGVTQAPPCTLAFSPASPLSFSQRGGEEPNGGSATAMSVTPDIRPPLFGTQGASQSTHKETTPVLTMSSQLVSSPTHAVTSSCHDACMGSKHSHNPFHVSPCQGEENSLDSTTRSHGDAAGVGSGAKDAVMFALPQATGSTATHMAPLSELEGKYILLILHSPHDVPDDTPDTHDENTELELQEGGGTAPATAARSAMSVGSSCGSGSLTNHHNNTNHNNNNNDNSSSTSVQIGGLTHVQSSTHTRAASASSAVAAMLVPPCDGAGAVVLSPMRAATQDGPTETGATQLLATRPPLPRHASTDTCATPVHTPAVVATASTPCGCASTSRDGTGHAFGGAYQPHHQLNKHHHHHHSSSNNIANSVTVAHGTTAVCAEAVGSAAAVAAHAGGTCAVLPCSIGSQHSSHSHKHTPSIPHGLTSAHAAGSSVCGSGTGLTTQSTRSNSSQASSASAPALLPVTGAAVTVSDVLHGVPGVTECNSVSSVMTTCTPPPLPPAMTTTGNTAATLTATTTTTTTAVTTTQANHAWNAMNTEPLPPRDEVSHVHPLTNRAMTANQLQWQMIAFYLLLINSWGVSEEGVRRRMPRRAPHSHAASREAAPWRRRSPPAKPNVSPQSVCSALVDTNRCERADRGVSAAHLTRVRAAREEGESGDVVIAAHPTVVRRCVPNGVKDEDAHVSDSWNDGAHDTRDVEQEDGAVHTGCTPDCRCCLRGMHACMELADEGDVEADDDDAAGTPSRAIIPVAVLELRNTPARRRGDRDSPLMRHMTSSTAHSDPASAAAAARLLLGHNNSNNNNNTLGGGHVASARVSRGCTPPLSAVALTRASPEERSVGAGHKSVLAGGTAATASNNNNNTRGISSTNSIHSNISTTLKATASASASSPAPTFTTTTTAAATAQRVPSISPLTIRTGAMMTGTNTHMTTPIYNSNNTAYPVTAVTASYSSLAVAASTRIHTFPSASPARESGAAVGGVTGPSPLPQPHTHATHPHPHHSSSNRTASSSVLTLPLELTGPLSLPDSPTTDSLVAACSHRPAVRPQTGLLPNAPAPSRSLSLSNHELLPATDGVCGACDVHEPPVHMCTPRGESDESDDATETETVLWRHVLHRIMDQSYAPSDLTLSHFTLDEESRHRPGYGGWYRVSDAAVYRRAVAALPEVHCGAAVLLIDPQGAVWEVDAGRRVQAELMRYAAVRQGAKCVCTRPEEDGAEGQPPHAASASCTQKIRAAHAIGQRDDSPLDELVTREKPFRSLFASCSATAAQECGGADDGAGSVACVHHHPYNSTSRAESESVGSMMQECMHADESATAFAPSTPAVIPCTHSRRQSPIPCAREGHVSVWGAEERDRPWLSLCEAAGVRGGTQFPWRRTAERCAPEEYEVLMRHARTVGEMRASSSTWASLPAASTVGEALMRRLGEEAMESEWILFFGAQWHPGTAEVLQRLKAWWSAAVSRADGADNDHASSSSSSSASVSSPSRRPKEIYLSKHDMRLSNDEVRCQAAEWRDTAETTRESTHLTAGADGEACNTRLSSGATTTPNLSNESAHGQQKRADETTPPPPRRRPEPVVVYISCDTSHKDCMAQLVPLPASWFCLPPPYGPWLMRVCHVDTLPCTLCLPASCRLQRAHDSSAHGRALPPWSMHTHTPRTNVWNAGTFHAVHTSSAPTHPTPTWLNDGWSGLRGMHVMPHATVPLWHRRRWGGWVCGSDGDDDEDNTDARMSRPTATTHRTTHPVRVRRPMRCEAEGVVHAWRSASAPSLPCLAGWLEQGGHVLLLGVLGRKVNRRAHRRRLRVLTSVCREWAEQRRSGQEEEEEEEQKGGVWRGGGVVPRTRAHSALRETVNRAHARPVSVRRTGGVVCDRRKEENHSCGADAKRGASSAMCESEHRATLTMRRAQAEEEGGGVGEAAVVSPSRDSADGQVNGVKEGGWVAGRCAMTQERVYFFDAVPPCGGGEGRVREEVCELPDEEEKGEGDRSGARSRSRTGSDGSHRSSRGSRGGVCTRSGGSSADLEGEASGMSGSCDAAASSESDAAASAETDRRMQLLQEYVYGPVVDKDVSQLPAREGEFFLVHVRLPQRTTAVLRRRTAGMAAGEGGGGSGGAVGGRSAMAAITPVRSQAVGAGVAVSDASDPLLSVTAVRRFVWGQICPKDEDEQK